jgi:hypothetical protein
MMAGRVEPCTAMAKLDPKETGNGYKKWNSEE